jgi:hypothetical protein
MTARLMRDIGYFVLRFNPLTAATLPLFLVSAFVARRRGVATAPLWELLVLGLPLLLIVDATLLRDAAVPTFSPAGVLHWSHSGWTRISYDPWSNQVVENAALFVPSGFAWNLLRRRGVAVWIGLTGVSLLMEMSPTCWRTPSERRSERASRGSSSVPRPCGMASDRRVARSPPAWC